MIQTPKPDLRRHWHWLAHGYSEPLVPSSPKTQPASALVCWRKPISLLLAMCVWGTTATSLAQTLHFKSGFDPGSTVVDANGAPPNPLSEGKQIIGVDNTSGWDWVADMVSEPSAPRIGNLHFVLEQLNNGAHVTIIDDPTAKNRGKVMQFWLQTPTDIKGRVQTNISKSDPDLNEVTSVVKMYLHSDLAVLKNKLESLPWFTVQELWTNPDVGTAGVNFRITVGIGKQAGAGQNLHWLTHADESGAGGATFWEQDTAAAGIWASDVIGQWVTFVMYYKKGDASTGRFRLKLITENGAEQELFNITNWTFHPTDPLQNTGLTHHQPHKMYAAKDTFDWIRNNSQGGNGAAIIYWDDWEYWEGDKYTNYMPAPFSLSATAMSGSQINLAWSNIPNETGFTLERATDPAFSAGLVTSTTGADVTAFNSTDLTASTTYYYRVRGTIGGVLSDWSPVASATTASANPPPTVSLTAPAAGAAFVLGETVPLAATASDADGIALVEFYQGATTFIGDDITSPYTFNWSPAAIGSYSLTAVATEGGTPFASTTSSAVPISVVANSVPAITTTTLSGGTVGTAYSQTLAATGGNGALAWSLASGALPTSLNLSSAGVVSGTPTVAGTANFTVRVADADGITGASDEDTQALSIAVSGGASTTVAFTSVGADDGWVLESSETSNSGGSRDATLTGSAALRVGDDNSDKQYRTIVSFDTSTIPDTATIVSATLKLKRGYASGTNPFTSHGLCHVDIVTGSFNGNASLRNADFEAAATATQVATMSDPVNDGDLSSGNLISAGLGAISKTGKTQLRVYLSLDDNDDRGNDYIGFYSGENGTAANRPVLEVTYQ